MPLAARCQCEWPFDVDTDAFSTVAPEPDGDDVDMAVDCMRDADELLAADRTGELSRLCGGVFDLKIREALKNNNPSLAQELGRKRQELITEFDRRGLKRKPAETRKPTESTEPTRHAPHSRARKHPRTGLPGQENST